MRCCTQRCRSAASVWQPLRDPAAKPAPNRRPLWLPLHCAEARCARLRSVPRQPNPQRKEHQENSRSSLPFSFSPCSLIKSTTGVSGMLARRALRVVSRTTAMHYKGVHRPLPEIARELNVGAIVEGTVQRSGARVCISAQLVHALTDNHLWAETYDRDLGDVLALQSEVAQAIAREVQVKLTPQEQAHLAQVHPVDPEAFEAYLKGRYHWNRRSREGLGKAIQYFQQAITSDPNCAAAYSGLADCISLLGWWA